MFCLHFLLFSLIFFLVFLFKTLVALVVQFFGKLCSFFGKLWLFSKRVVCKALEGQTRILCLVKETAAAGLVSLCSLFKSKTSLLGLNRWLSSLNRTNLI